MGFLFLRRIPLGVKLAAEEDCAGLGWEGAANFLQEPPPAMTLGGSLIDILRDMILDDGICDCATCRILLIRSN